MHRCAGSSCGWLRSLGQGWNLTNEMVSNWLRRANGIVSPAPVGLIVGGPGHAEERVVRFYIAEEADSMLDESR